MRNRISLFVTAALALSLSTTARPNVGQQKTIYPKVRAGCSPTTTAKDLDINNVRARIMNGGDMWWDGVEVARYEVPKTSTTPKKNSLFAGSIWIGGIDKSSNTLKVAGQTYRQNGNDYWSGPLDGSGAISANECSLWDNMWKVDNRDIIDFKTIIANAGPTPQEITQAILDNDNSVAEVIKTWPGTGNALAEGAGNLPLSLSSNRKYAPFVDNGGDSAGYRVNRADGIYNYRHGDYPAILGDQYIWWIFNDVGNVKTETGSAGIGLEISGAAFAFATNDALNDATFYTFNVKNTATSNLDSTYFSTWCDADLGFYNDDYVGCDVDRSLGILYNGDDDDEGPTGYGKGLNIPMIGIDYFKGPIRRTPGQPDQELGMTGFTYFNNNSGNQGNPSTTQHFYNYMRGYWKDGTPFVENCTAYGNGVPIPYVFAEPYRECNPCGNLPFDRRFIHSSGPLTLYPGAENEITIGALWVPGVGGNCPSFGKIQAADDIAQNLFNEGFKIPNGPMAPDLVIRPYDKQFVFQINNPSTSNNFNEAFGNKDSAIKYQEVSKNATRNFSADSLYKFEGYIVYQLKDASVSLGDARKTDGTLDETKAKIVFQCDVKNDITKIYNFELDAQNFGTYRRPRLMVTGKDEGIVRNFTLTEDAFSTNSNKTLTNYRTYYYAVVAYAYNNFKAYKEGEAETSQTEQYRESRIDGRSAPLKTFAVTPDPAKGNLYAVNGYAYGDGVEIKRVEGKGNGGFGLELTQESEDEIVKNGKMANPIYKAGSTPVEVKVISPDSVKPGLYTITMLVDSNWGDMANFNARGAKARNTKWQITREYNGTTETIISDRNLVDYNEQILTKYGVNGNADAPTSDWGLSINTKQAARPSDSTNKDNNGLISGTLTYDDLSKPWLFGVADAGGNSLNNWHRVGNSSVSPPTTFSINMSPYAPYTDPFSKFDGLVNGWWGAYNLLNRENSDKSRMGMMYYKNPFDRNNNSLNNVHSVDVVFTSDRSKWTRCSVVEMNDGTNAAGNQTAATFSEGNAFKYNLRRHASLERDPDANGNPVYSTSDSGHSWFPGYAINLETGERLNILFGEDSGDPVNNGTDMIWNPTITAYDPINRFLRWGGRHIVYISSTRYDAEGADFIFNGLKTATNDAGGGSTVATMTGKQQVYHSMMWASPALAVGLKTWKEGLIPTRTKVAIKVARPYTTYDPGTGALVNGGWPVYQFNTTAKASADLNNPNNPNSDTKKLLDRIKVTPNPYFAQSAYEENRLDQRVKILNLPEVADINIYTLDGSLVRTIRKSDKATSFVDWDLRNNQNVPIASGLYLMQVKIKTVKGDAETILKFQAIMRPTDITTF
jgi:hypothetical protein